MISLVPLRGCRSNPLIGISILDCPAQNHTSPISTSPITAGTPSPSDITISYGPPALGVDTVTHHNESFATSDTALAPSHEPVTSTLHPGVALPRSLTSVCCCSTIPSDNTWGSTTRASTVDADNTIPANTIGIRQATDFTFSFLTFISNNCFDS